MSLVLNGTTGITNPGAYTGDGVSFADNTPSNTLVTTTGGNVGIGTSSPASALSFGGTKGLNAAAGVPTLRMYDDGTNSFGIAASSSGVSGLDISANFSAGNIRFFAGGSTASPTERMRIDSSGNLLVGTTTANPGNGNNTIGTSVQGATGFYGCREPANYCVYLNSTALDGANRANYISFGLYGTTNIGAIHANGLATVYATSSDYRLKENVTSLTGSLEKVLKLNPVSWKWKAIDATSQGFIAHELQEVVPECVTGEKDAVDADGKPQYQGIDTSFLVATLTAAIQELKAELDTVKAELATLKGATE